MRRGIRVITVLSLVTFLFISVAHAVGKEQIVWKFSCFQPEGSVMVTAVQKYLCDPIFEKTNGRLKLVIYPAAVLGGERDVMQSLQLGSVEVMHHSEAIVGLFVPEFNFLSLPFLFNNKEHFERFIPTDSWKKLTQKTEKYGFYLMETGVGGFRLPTLRSKLIEKPADFKGLKIRTMEQPIQIATMKALGATPTPCPWPEIYQSVRTKVVDGQYNCYLGNYQLSIHEVAPYLTNLPLFISLECVSISKVAFDKLPKDYQEVVREVFKANYRKMLELTYEQALDQLEEQAVTGFKYYHRIDNLDPFHKAVQSVYDNFVKDNPEAKECIDAVEAVR